MDYDKAKVDAMILALLFLVLHGDRDGHRAWKGFDPAAAVPPEAGLLRDVELLGKSQIHVRGAPQSTMDRLHEKGFISNPKGRAKSVAMTTEGAARSEELFRKFSGQS